MRLPWRRGERASSLDLLVVGLGNPGREYARTRHNVGWMVVDELARRNDASFKSKFNGRLADVRIDGRRVALLKPETYMNESGRSISAAMRFYKAPVEAVLVLHDDVDLEPGRLQARLGGGLAGHNGLRSISRSTGTRDYLRVRIGIGRPPGRQDAADFVLKDFSATERKTLDLLVAEAADAAELLLERGLEAAQNVVHPRS